MLLWCVFNEYTRYVHIHYTVDDRKTTKQILLKTFVVKEKISLFARIHCKTKTPCRAIHIKSVIIYVQTSLVHLWTMGGKK